METPVEFKMLAVEETLVIRSEQIEDRTSEPSKPP